MLFNLSSGAATKKQPASAVIKVLPAHTNPQSSTLHCFVTPQTVPLFSEVIILAPVIICVVKTSSCSEKDAQPTRFVQVDCILRTLIRWIKEAWLGTVFHLHSGEVNGKVLKVHIYIHTPPVKTTVCCSGWAHKKEQHPPPHTHTLIF